MTERDGEVRRWLVHEHGAPAEVMELRASVVPPAADDELVIDVEACALNFADDLLCRGKYQEKPPLPFTPGLEVAGVVIDAPAGARYGPGDRVVGAARLPYGALAERCRARVDDVYRLPAEIPAVDAAAMHVTYQTCWFALHRRARMQPNDMVLVHAGAGGVGSAAIQLAKAAGARVIATAGGAGQGRSLRRVGRRHRDRPPHRRLRRGRERSHRMAWAPTSSSTRSAVTRFEKSRHCIAWEGRILVVGAASGTYFSAPTNHVMVKNYSVVGVHWGGYLTRNPELVRGAHDDLMRLYRSGVVKPLVSSVVALDAARDALVGLAEGRTVGKIVVRIP